MGGLQRFQMRVILSRAIPFYDFMPYGINKGIEVLDLHGCNAVHIDFNVSQKLDKILVRGKFAEQAVVDTSTLRSATISSFRCKFHQGRVYLLSVFCPAEQIIKRYLIEVCQRYKIAVVDSL